MCVWRGSSTRDLHVKVHAPTQLIFTCSNSRIEIEPFLPAQLLRESIDYHQIKNTFIFERLFAAVFILDYKDNSRELPKIFFTFKISESATKAFLSTLFVKSLNLICWESRIEENNRVLTSLNFCCEICSMLLSDREFSLLNEINHLLSLVLKLPQEHSYRVYTHPSTISITV